MIKAFLRNISWQVLQGRSVLIFMFNPNGDGLAVIRGFWNGLDSSHAKVVLITSCNSD